MSVATNSMVYVAQLVEPQIVILVSVGSSPIVHPNFPYRANFDGEALPLKQMEPSSNLGRGTKNSVNRIAT